MPPARLEIRECTPEDAEALHAVLDAVARERRYLAMIEPPSIEAIRSFTASVQQRGGVRVVALDGARIVGWCTIDPHAREGFRHGGVLGMGLLATHRRRGHGRRLLEAALALAQARGIRRVELEVFASNIVAIRLYEAFGFAREGVKRGARILDGRADDLVLMARHADSEARAASADVARGARVRGGASEGDPRSEPQASEGAGPVQVFFYGSYMNRAVLGEVGLAPRRFEVASLAGFDIRVAPRANLVRTSGGVVFGVLASATHAELERLYAHARDALGEVYLPEAVLVHTRSGTHEPALCYVAPRMLAGPAEPAYLDRILEPARELGFPAWYLARLEAFRR